MLPMKIWEDIRVTLRRRESQGLLRRLGGGILAQKGWDFCSNDYLGFARDSSLYKEANIGKMGRLGSTGSRLLSGESSATSLLEADLARYFEEECALLFGSGYMANIAFFSTVPRRGDVILYDSEIHASIKDGFRLGTARYYRFRHNDMSDLEEKLSRYRSGQVYIAVEGIYSMSGDLARLSDIFFLAGRYGACVVLDEAHSTGVRGNQGKGLWAEHKESQEKNGANVIRMHTFGKAWGLSGACIVSKSALCAYLVNYARPFIYSTALPAYHISLLGAVLSRFENNFAPRAALNAVIRDFEAGMSSFRERGKGEYLPTGTPIQRIGVGEGRKCRLFAEKMMSLGFQLSAILSPTVSSGKEMLRICLHSFNTSSQLKGLWQSLRDVSQAL